MSNPRFIPSLTLLGTLTLACCLAAQTAVPAAIDGAGVTVDTGGPVLHRGSVVYPDAARRARIQGVVAVEASLDSTGNVVETRVLSGPMELRRAAQQSVLNWHFAMDTALNTRVVKVNFDLPSASASSQAAPAPGMDAATRAALEERMKTMQAQLGPNAMVMRGGVALEGKRLTRIAIYGLSDQNRNDLTAKLPVHIGDAFAADTLDKLRATVREFDEHLVVGTAANQNGEVTLNIQVAGGAPMGDFTAHANAALPPPADGTKRLTIGGNIQQSKLVSQARPSYPPLAKQARISGVVKLSALISKEGNVVNLAVISGHPLLIPSALEAVQKWVYQKTLLNGDPVEVVTQIDVNYTLSDDPPVQQ